MRIPLMVTIATALFTSPALAKDPALGATTYTVYESFMSPQQQSDDESNAPKPIAQKTHLQSTEPSVPREERKSRGWGQIRFTRDFTKALVDVEITGVKADDILMFHIHCGPPGLLGPILVDLGQFGTLSKQLANGKLSVVVTNKNLSYIHQFPKEVAPPEACPVDLSLPTQAKTIAGLEALARKGALYFNLHTKANTFYGEVRGQIYPAQ